MHLSHNYGKHACVKSELSFDHFKFDDIYIISKRFNYKLYRSETSTTLKSCVFVLLLTSLIQLDFVSGDVDTVDNNDQRTFPLKGSNFREP